jgi:hypothetical protein
MSIEISKINQVQSSGSLRFSDLRNKLKETISGSISLEELYQGGSYVPIANENANIPTSGPNKLSNYYGSCLEINASITGVEQNLNANLNIFGSNYGKTVRKTINVNGYVISQNANPALTIPSGAGSTITVKLTSGGIFGHRATDVGGGGESNGGAGKNGYSGNLALRTNTNIRIIGTGGVIYGGGGSGGGGGGGGQEGSGGINGRQYSCGFFGWQVCTSCDNYIGGGSDSGGSGGNGGVGRGYSWNGSSLTSPSIAGSGGYDPGNGGGVGGSGGSGGEWGSAGQPGGSGNPGSTGPGGNCAGGGGGSEGGPEGLGGPGGISIEGYNRVISIESTSILAGPTTNN